MKQPEEIRKTYPGLEALSVEELDDLLQEEFLSPTKTARTQT
ncbi:MAG: hypothetical protein ACLUNZ_03920 [Evtepia sp.]